jgi:uncharacterized protein DUF6152
MKRVVFTILLILALSGGAGRLLAHHSLAAEFDDKQPLKLTGTLTKVEWTNPQIWYYIDVKNPDGSTTTWGYRVGRRSVGDERGRSNATIFDRKRFAPFKPGGEPFYEPRTGDDGAVVTGVRDHREAGVGEGRIVRVRLPGEQPLSGREVRRREVSELLA